MSHMSHYIIGSGLDSLHLHGHFTGAALDVATRSLSSTSFFIVVQWTSLILSHPFSSEVQVPWQKTANIMKPSLRAFSSSSLLCMKTYIISYFFFFSDSIHFFLILVLVQKPLSVGVRFGIALKSLHQISSCPLPPTGISIVVPDLLQVAPGK